MLSHDSISLGNNIVPKELTSSEAVDVEIHVCIGEVQGANRGTAEARTKVGNDLHLL